MTAKKSNDQRLTLIFFSHYTIMSHNFTAIISSNGPCIFCTYCGALSGSPLGDASCSKAPVAGNCDFPCDKFIFMFFFISDANVLQALVASINTLTEQTSASIHTLTEQTAATSASIHTLTEQTAATSASIHTLTEQTSASIHTLTELVQDTQEAVKEGNYMHLDPYNDMTATSIGKSNNLRSMFLNHYELNAETAQCMITKTFASTASRGGQSSVILAHLLPRSTKMCVLDVLGMHTSNIDTIRNSLLLCKGIEEAFDRKQVSFVPVDDPFVDGQFKMMIWEDKFKTTPIYEGSLQTLGEFENAPLDLVVNGTKHEVFRRVLSYQAYMACRHWFQYGNRKGLAVDCDTSEYSGSYQNSRRDFADRFRKALERELNEAGDDI